MLQLYGQYVGYDTHAILPGYQNTSIFPLSGKIIPINNFQFL